LNLLKQEYLLRRKPAKRVLQNIATDSFEVCEIFFTIVIAPLLVPGKILSVREALSNPLRRRIVLTLMDNPGMSVRQLARVLGVGAGTLSGHLLILQRLGLIHEERNGRKVLLYLNEDYLLGKRGP